MNRFTHSMTLMGKVQAVSPRQASFEIECRSGDRLTVFASSETTFRVLENLDKLDRDRAPSPPGFDGSAPSLIEKYVREGALLVIEGIHQEHGEQRRFDARRVHLVETAAGRFLFEETHWWLSQARSLANQWLDALFGERRSYQLDDFAALYRTTLEVNGLPSDDDLQECAVLSRLIYGLSSAYHLSGDERYRLAAEAGVRFQRDAFRSLSHDGRYCFWAHGRRRRRYGAELIVPSENGADAGSIAIYEQIYALAGLAQYYRITLDPEVLADIRRTMRAFDDYFLDEARAGSDRPGHGGYFSHLDYATMRPVGNRNPQNDLKKNWNSIGDHVPAYLVNLILALDPLPMAERGDLAELLDECRRMLDRVTDLILDKFPDRDPEVPYLDERFHADWTPDHDYGWQKNRAIVGHNFKVAWNLTRIANYYDDVIARGGHDEALTQRVVERRDRCMVLAERLARSMTVLGIDQLRGGCFDALERRPENGMPIEFAWSNTKDFWQQEQAILAYLILYGRTRDPYYLDLARETEAFWNVFFLDREHRGIYFRVTDDGLPVLTGDYAVRGGHSDASGYHVFELDYLAHVYTRAHVAGAAGTDETMCLHFKPDPRSGRRSINVLPDFFRPGDLEIVDITVGGRPRRSFDPTDYQVELGDDDLGREVAVVFRARRAGGDS